MIAIAKHVRLPKLVSLLFPQKLNDEVQLNSASSVDAVGYRPTRSSIKKVLVVSVQLVFSGNVIKYHLSHVARLRISTLTEISCRSVNGGTAFVIRTPLIV